MKHFNVKRSFKKSGFRPGKKVERFQAEQIPTDRKTSRVIELLNRLSKGEKLTAPAPFPVSSEPKDFVPKESPTSSEPQSCSTPLPDIKILPEEDELGYYIKTDNDLAEADTFLQTAIQFCLLVKKIDYKIKVCRDRLIEENRLIQDLLHEIQQPLKDEKDSITLYRLLHRASRRRLEYKDLWNILNILNDYISAHKTTFNGLMPVVNLAEKKVNNRKNRVYMQKSSMPLPVGDAYRNLSIEEQEQIRIRYEQSKQKS